MKAKERNKHFSKVFIYFRDGVGRGREGEREEDPRERETLIGYLSYTP